jgi:hypothetical protein
MYAITVSTNYSEILNIILPQNYNFFEKWYIITDPKDEKTINVIRGYSCPNVEIVFFDFYANGAIFNKGGAIKHCQQNIIPSDYDGQVLLLDSDIYLPNNFNDLINNMRIEASTLYGATRVDFHSYYNFRNGIVNNHYGLNFMGYFQLYKQAPHILYKDSNDCSWCDQEFLWHFHNKVLIPDLTVSHLGRDGRNWHGRKGNDDFEM